MTDNKKDEEGRGTRPMFNYNKVSSVPLLAEYIEGMESLRQILGLRADVEKNISELVNSRDAKKNDPKAGLLVHRAIPAGWLDSLGKIAAERAALDYKLVQLGELHNVCNAEIEARVDGSLDDMLSFLNGKLQSVLAPLSAAAAKLEGIDTAGAAVKAGAADSWKVFEDAAEVYAEILRAQDVVMSIDKDAFLDAQQATDVKDKRANTCRIADMHIVWPEWTLGASVNFQQEADAWYEDKGFVRVAEEPKAPWPRDNARFLLWAVRRDARLWVATSDDLSDDYARRKAFMEEDLKRADEVLNHHDGRNEFIARAAAGEFHPQTVRVIQNRDRAPRFA